MTVSRVLAFIVMVVAPVACAEAPRPRMEMRSCDEAGITEAGARCGTLDVFEDRSTKAGRKIRLNVVVLPASGPKAQPDPVFWLEGGPGGAATRAIGPVAHQYFKEVRSERDLVFVDQRGTGQSNPLTCGDIGEVPANLDRYFGKLFPIDTIRACRDKLQPIADLTKYTTSIAADDLDDVRKALGYEKINLAGASYGTIVAQVYLRQHPGRVRSAFLIGVATPDFRLPLPFARASQNALEELFKDCAADVGCRAAYPDLRSEFESVLARFDRGPLTVTMTDPATQRPRTVKLERESYVERLRAMMYSTGGARFVPIVVHQAFLDNFLVFQTIAARFNLGGAQSARGMYFSVTCAESIPFIVEQEILDETRGMFLGDRRIRAHAAACADWPKGSAPKAFTDLVKADVPVVMFAGEADGSTPPWFAEAAVKFMPNGRVITAAHTGHQIDGPCTWNLMQAFVKRPSVRELDASCVANARRPPFATETPK